MLSYFKEKKPLSKVVLSSSPMTFYRGLTAPPATTYDKTIVIKSVYNLYHSQTPGGDQDILASLWRCCHVIPLHTVTMTQKPILYWYQFDAKILGTCTLHTGDGILPNLICIY